MLFQRVRYHYAHVHFPLYRGDPKGGDGLTNTNWEWRGLGWASSLALWLGDGCRTNTVNNANLRMGEVQATAGSPRKHYFFPDENR